MSKFDSVQAKVEAVFRDLAGDRAERLDGSRFPKNVAAVIQAALEKEDGLEPEQAANVAFHMVDWNSDAAFVVAVLLFPERFTAEEIGAGLSLFLAHAPGHVVEAARLMDWEVLEFDSAGE